MTADPITEWMAAWWPRPLPPPALRCPNCGTVDSFLIVTREGTVRCPECRGHK